MSGKWCESDPGRCQAGSHSPRISLVGSDLRRVEPPYPGGSVWQMHQLPHMSQDHFYEMM